MNSLTSISTYPLLFFGTYINVLNDTFENLNNWQAVVEPGQQTGNNEYEYYTSRSVNAQITTTSA